MFPVTEIFNNINVKNRGVAENTTFDLLKRIKLVCAGKPKKIFIMDGINDITGGIHERATFANFDEIVNYIQTNSPSTQIYIESILPNSDAQQTNIVKEYNTRLEQYCATHGVTFINLFPLFLDNSTIKASLTSDGTHLTGDAYMIWKQAVWKYVN